MKTKSSAKSSAALTPKAKSAPKDVQLDPAVPTMETRVLKPTGIIPLVLVAALRDRITAPVRADLEAQATTQSSADVDVQMPVNVYTSEAIAIAARIEWHQVPRDGVPVTLAGHAARLGGDVAAQIVYLADQVRIADSIIAQSRVTDPEKLMAKGQPILVRLRSALEVVVDDGVRDDKDIVVESLRKAHDSVPGSKADMASALAAYADACNLLEADLADLAGFDPKLVVQAAEIADALSASGNATKTDTKSVIGRRNRLMGMIRTRLAKVRRIARFTFSDHPEVVAQFFSAFRRERRGAKGGQEPVDPSDDSVEPEPAPTPEPSDDPT